MSYSPEKIRDVAVVGHQGSGKTTLVEALAFTNGAIPAQGSIEKGDTVSDFLPYEKDKKVSISSAVVPFERDGYKVNLIDLPGNDDFIFETIGVTRVVKGAIIVIDASKGVQNGTVKSFRLLKRRGVPMFIFVNKMDKEEVDFDKIFEEIKSKLDPDRCVPFSYPIGRKENFDGFVNVVELKARKYNGVTCEDDVIYEDKKQHVYELHNRLCEAVAGVNDELLERFFSGEQFTQAEIKSGLREAVLKGELFPVIVGSATKRIGMNTLTSMLIDYLPSPADLKPIDGKDASGNIVSLRTTADGPLALQVFKNSYNNYLGLVSTFKVVSGTVRVNDTLICPNSNREYRISALYTPMGEKLTPVDSIGPGDIGVTTRLDDIKLSYTLTTKDNPVTLPPVNYPTPTYFRGIVPATKKDSDKLFPSVSKMAMEDPTISLEKDETTDQIRIGALSSTHLSYLLDRLKADYQISFTTETLKISYRETITASAQAEGRYIKQTGGSGYYGVVIMRFEPADETGFATQVFGGHIDKGYFPAVEKGFYESLQQGGLIGAPVINVKATLTDGKQHPVDSNEMAFKQAAILAFRNAYDKCRPILLEPYSRMTVDVPNEYLGNILSDLAKRRARILSTEENASGMLEVVAVAPQSEIVEYANEIKGLAKGMAFFNMQFEDYEQVPERIAEDVIKAHKESSK